MRTLTDIGNTPLVALDGIYIKLECSNPGGSVKDRVARYLLERALERGDIRAGDTIVEATSGNTGIALAMVGRELGLRVLAYMPEHMSVERRDMMERMGAEVVLTPRSGGFEEPVRRRDEHRGTPGHWIPDQFGNPENVACHVETTGAELVRQLEALQVRRVDALVAGIGTGGTMMGVGQALRAVYPNVRRIAVEPEESAVMSGGNAGDHGIFGIGDGFVPPIVDTDQIDDVARIHTVEAHAYADLIRRRWGYCVGRSAGANTAVASRLHRRGMTVVTLWPDCSNRYESVGLKPPGGEGVTCPCSTSCAKHAEEWLGS